MCSKHEKYVFILHKYDGRSVAILRDIFILPFWFQSQKIVRSTLYMSHTSQFVMRSRVCFFFSIRIPLQHFHLHLFEGKETQKRWNFTCLMELARSCNELWLRSLIFFFLVFCLAYQLAEPNFSPREKIIMALIHFANIQHSNVLVHRLCARSSSHLTPNVLTQPNYIHTAF